MLKYVMGKIGNGAEGYKVQGKNIFPDLLLQNSCLGASYKKYGNSQLKEQTD